MTDFETVILLFYVWICGVVLGYILWAPDTRFKRGLIEGLSLHFIWRRFLK